MNGSDKQTNLIEIVEKKSPARFTQFKITKFVHLREKSRENT